MKKTNCDKCGRDISNNNYQKHINSCDGTYFTGPTNPSKLKYKSKEEYLIGHKEHLKKARAAITTSWKKGLTRETNDGIKRQSETRHNRLMTGEIQLSGFCSPTYFRSQKHLDASSKGGGYKEKAGRSNGGYRTDSSDKERYLQSSYELKFADLLTELGIFWIRPKSLEYIHNDKIKKYFPDFLLENTIFVDTKNDYLIIKDDQKIKLVENHNNIVINIVRFEQITIEYIQTLVGSHSRYRTWPPFQESSV